MKVLGPIIEEYLDLDVVGLPRQVRLFPSTLLPFPWASSAGSQVKHLLFFDRHRCLSYPFGRQESHVFVLLLGCKRKNKINDSTIS